MSPIIREATKKDLPVLNSFMDALVDVERSMDTTLKDGKIVYYDLEGFIKSKHAILYVIELNTEIVASGYAKINLDKTYLKHDKHAYLGFMYVKEKHRGNGYNKLIVDALLTWSKEKNISEIRLDVYNSNPSAIRAYEKVGFKKHMLKMRMDINDLEN
ncbi:MAG: GNAT family N-acetyltransferase [Polaribacter sp.]|nr:GNAT family N-acetyltransferase [Polaribacter sp.]MDG1810965.1 GNAT family N-acetyltransferase [Polaribacter sp.]MDG1993994.1 GNAT family N-acetyltransferase [Polaribacter sp.]